MKFARIITSVSCAVAGVLATGPALAERTYVAQPMPTAHYETPHPMAPALGQRAVVPPQGTPAPVQHQPFSAQQALLWNLKAPPVNHMPYAGTQPSEHVAVERAHWLQGHSSLYPVNQVPAYGTIPATYNPAYAYPYVNNAYPYANNAYVNGYGYGNTSDIDAEKAELAGDVQNAMVQGRLRSNDATNLAVEINNVNAMESNALASDRGFLSPGDRANLYAAINSIAAQFQRDLRR